MTSSTMSKSERTRTRILESAVTAFGANGLRSTSVAAVARAAGVSAPTVFTYWPSKEALFEAAVDHDARQVILQVLQSVTLSEEPVGHIELVEPAGWTGLVDQLVGALEAHPLSRRVLAGDGVDFLDGLLRVAAFEDLHQIVAAAVQSEQRRGTTRLDLDPALAAIGIETIAIALAIMRLRLQTDPEPERLAGVAEVLLASFRPSPPR